MNPIFYREKNLKYDSNLESKKFVGLDGNLIEFSDNVNLNENNFKKIRQEHMTLYASNKYKQDNNTNLISAIAYFDSNNIKGTVTFNELTNGMVKVIVNLEGFEANSTHGFHVHKSGDLSRGCDSLCEHFNPFNKSHGGRHDIERHVGDLGNITANSLGKIQIEFTDHLIKLRGGDANIIGRGLVIHAEPDDCGKTSHELSKKTGNSGKRIACAIIGYSSTCNK